MRFAPFSFALMWGILCLQSCGGVAQIPHESDCRRTPSLDLVSLAMTPDPLPQNGKITQWRVILRSDSGDLCKATLAVVEADTDKPVTLEQFAELSPGNNQLTVASLDDYRLSGGATCFEVSVHMHNQPISVKNARRFCARAIDRSWWTMR